MHKKSLDTLVVFFVIFVMAMLVVERAEHKERIETNKKLLKALDKNSKLRIKYIKQMEVVEKSQIKTNELLKYQNNLLKNIKH